MALDSFEDAVEEEAMEEEPEEARAVSASADEGESAPLRQQSDVPALGTGGSGDGSAPGALQPINIGRDIIFTAEISVAVDNVGEAAGEAMRAIETLGGLLFGQETSTDGVNRTLLTFKVRPADFQEAVSRLGGIGDLRDQRISSQDVTARVSDLRSQIITAEVSVERLRGFLQDATGLEQVARLEAQLLERETTLERLRGSLRTIEDRVDLATITVSLVEIVPGPALTLTQTAYSGHDEGISCQGLERLTVDEDDSFTVCLRVENTGDTHLTDFVVIDEGFGISSDDVVVTAGSLDGRLAPGERLVAYFEADSAVFTTELRTQVSAQVINEDGADLGVARVGARGNGFLEVRQSTALPGFKDSLDSGLDVLAKMIGIGVILFGLLLPFFWVPLFAWAALRLLRSRSNRSGTTVHVPATNTADTEHDVSV